MRTISRRSFLAELAAGAVIAPWVTSGLFAQSPNSVVHHATFGCSGQAFSDIGELAGHKSVKVVAGCDVDEKRTGEFRKKFPDARVYKDYRELFEKEKDLQSVNVSTPDHMHATIGMTALNRGIALYGQKPLTHNLHECRRLATVAREKKLVSQMGIQIHSSSQYRTACHIIQNGIIGKVKEVHTWSSKKWGDNNPMPTKTDPVPEGLDWDAWLAVATERPFIKDFYHPGNWRKRLDFGTGTFGDMGCHIYDPVFKALALTAPISVLSEGAAPNDHSWATDAIIHYIFPGTAFTEGKTVNVTWYDGDRRPSKEVQALAGIDPNDKALHLPDQGSIFIGTDGNLILPHIDRARLTGAAKDKTFEKVASENHYHQFIEAVLGNKKNGDANFDYAGPLTESVLLGSVASRFPKQLLEWDVAAQKFPNHPAADVFVGRKYRKGWETAGL
jgi:predicted dehydrogenase